MEITKAIEKVAHFKDLSEEEMHSVFYKIMSGLATPAQISSFITALRMKGETVDEITGAARVMREKSLKVKSASPLTIDTCGTGGSKVKTFNISTCAAFVLAGCGIKVAKHGNRAASGRCGSADVLEELGVKLDVSNKLSEKCLNKVGIGFLFAPLFHGAMKHAQGPRREIKMRTVFNILGPLCNPASAKYQVLGVYDAKLTETMARVLKKLGSKHAFIVHGCDTLDEITITGRTRVTELKGGKIKSFYVSPAAFGMKKGKLKDIKGSSAKENAKVIRGVLSGKKGAAKDVVLMNASAGLVACGKAKNFKEGVRLAEEAVTSGRALRKLEELIAFTNGKKK